MISFLPSWRSPKATRTGPAQGTGAGLAGEHDPIEHQSLVAVLQRPAMEGGHRGIERLGNLAHCAGAYPASEQGKQRLTHLARR